jgi:hypothetical protein
LNDQLLWLHLDTGDVVPNCDGLGEVGSESAVFSDRLGHNRLDLRGGDTTDATGLVALSLHKSGRDIVTVPGGSLSDMTGGHAMAAVIEETSHQQRLGAGPGALVPDDPQASAPLPFSMW